MNYKNKKSQNRIFVENLEEVLTLSSTNINGDTFFKYDKSKKDSLQYSIQKTRLCRLKASDRLKYYNTITNWIISIISLLLIILPVYGITIGFESEESRKFLTFLEISFATIILVFTQIISNFQYAVKSLRFHQCAIELSSLDRKLDFIKVDDKNKISIDKFKQIYNEYISILTKYDNHDTVDYEEYCMKHKLKNICNNDDINDSKPHKLLVYSKKYVFGLLPQWILLLVALFMVFYLFSLES